MYYTHIYLYHYTKREKSSSSVCSGPSAMRTQARTWISCDWPPLLAIENGSRSWSVSSERFRYLRFFFLFVLMCLFDILWSFLTYLSELYFEDFTPYILWTLICRWLSYVRVPYMIFFLTLLFHKSYINLMNSTLNLFLKIIVRF